VTALLQPLASAPVTQWPERLALTLVVVVLIAGVLGLMRWGWVRRARGQVGLSPLPVVPEPPDPHTCLAVDCRYLGATRSGDWLDRFVIHGLGVPSQARVLVTPAAVWILRSGAPDLYLSSRDVTGARHDRGIAGRVYESDGVVVISWSHDGQPIDVGLRVRDAARAESLRAAVVAMSDVPVEPGETPLSPSTPGDHA
jgi:hypothetical protein